MHDWSINVVMWMLCAMAMISEHTDALLSLSILFEICWQNLDQRRIGANGYRHEPLKTRIFETGQGDMCTHTCDCQAVCCATANPQGWMGTWAQLHYDTRLGLVYEESQEFRYPCEAKEVQSCNTWMRILLLATIHARNASHYVHIVGHPLSRSRVKPRSASQRQQ